VDRLLGSGGSDPAEVVRRWAQDVIGTHPSVIIALDGTDFDADDPTTLCVYLVTQHGRAMPIAS
jgi:hypothetical protein